MSYSAINRQPAPGPPPHLVHVPSGPLSLTAVAVTSGAGAWPSANLAIYTPFRNPWQALVRKVVLFNGSTVSGNFDVGIYDSAGVRLWSSGSTAHANSDAEQVVDVSPDLLVTPGVLFVGLAFSNATATLVRRNDSVAVQAVGGIYMQATAFPLPSTATFAFDYTYAYQPMLALAFEATVS